MVAVYTIALAAEDMHGHFLFALDVSTQPHGDPTQTFEELRTDDNRAGLINMRVRIHVAYVLIAVTYIATICSILFGCHPMEKNWQINPNPGSEYDCDKEPMIYTC